MIYPNTRVIYRVIIGDSIMYGEFDSPEVTGRTRYFFYPENDFDTGTIGFMIKNGPVVDFGWDEQLGVHGAKIEEVTK